MTNPCNCKAEHWQPHADTCPAKPRQPANELMRSLQGMADNPPYLWGTTNVRQVLRNAHAEITQLRALAIELADVLQLVEWDCDPPKRVTEMLEAAEELRPASKPTAVEPRASQPSAFDQSCPFQPSRDMAPHTTEDDFRHFLAYEKLSGQPPAELHRLRLAYYAGADVGVPSKAHCLYTPNHARCHLYPNCICGPASKSDACGCIEAHEPLCPNAPR